MAMISRGTLWILIAALAASALTGCASEESAGRFVVEPDRYVLYNCAELAVQAQANITRQHELEVLMAKAEAGSGGKLVSSVAYRPEYIQLRGEMNELRKTGTEKNCKSLPGVGALGGRASDQVVR